MTQPKSTTPKATTPAKESTAKGTVKKATAARPKTSVKEGAAFKAKIGEPVSAAAVVSKVPAKKAAAKRPTAAVAPPTPKAPCEMCGTKDVLETFAVTKVRSFEICVMCKTELTAPTEKVGE